MRDSECGVWDPKNVHGAIIIDHSIIGHNRYVGRRRLPFPFFSYGTAVRYALCAMRQRQTTDTMSRSTRKTIFASLYSM